jgi:hypothetical protein
MRNQFTKQKYFAILLAAVITMSGFTNPTRAAGAVGSADAQARTTAPANDDFANAQALTGNNGVVFNTTAGATKETAEPAHARNRGGASIWYKYQATATEVLKFETSGSNFDTLLAVYKGSTLQDLKLIAANDDAPAGTTSIVRVGAGAGDIFYIAVDGYSPSAGTVASGSVTFTYNFNSVAANDNFGNAQTLTGPSGKLVTASNVGATRETGDPQVSGNGGGRSLWYKWVAPSGSNRSYTFTVESIGLSGLSAVGTQCAIVTGPNLNSLNQITGSNHYYTNNLSFVPNPGTTYYLFLDGIDFGSGVAAGTFTISYGITKDVKAADFDRDAKSDITVFRPSNGTWYTIDSITDQVTAAQFGANGDQPFLVDMDYDGQLDRTVYRSSTNAWFIDSSNFGLQAFAWGTAGDIPLIQQSYYSNRFTVFRPSNGFWYMATGFGDNGGAASWGTNGDIPLSVDFFGDGSDLKTVFRPSNGTWYSVGAVYLSVQFGMNGDKPVPADYDGDGKMDIAVFRPSNGTWYILRSSDNGVTAMQWGQAGDIPQPADYDGDGRSDIAVFRGGTWYILPSQSFTLRVVQFGLPGDIPVTAPIH